MVPWLIIITANTQVLNFAFQVADTTQNSWLNITSYVSIVVALIALVGTFVSRKVKSPADELARADFAYKKINERLEEVNKDRVYLQSVIDTLREQLRKLDQEAGISIDDKRNLRRLVTEGERRIEELSEQRDALQDRLDKIADKIRLGQVITLADVYGDDLDIRTPTLEEIELTVPPQDLPGYSDRKRQAEKKKD